MGPTKASHLVKKRFCKVSREWPDKDVAHANKSKVKKRKLSDVMDYRWTKEELKQFYEAFRKYGKNWKKVAGLIRNKSLDMVESLHNFNKTYLSLPEGMATADGFVAMVTDHYNNLDLNDCDYERKSAIKTLKPLDSSEKCVLDISKGSERHHLQNQSVQSGYKCMPNKYSEGIFTGCWTRAVRKRTPRVPVIHNQALALMEASQGGVSPPVLGSPGRSELTLTVKEKAEADVVTSSDINVGLNENCLEGCSGRMQVGNGVLGRGTRMLDIDGVDQSGNRCKVKMLQEMRPKIPGTNNCEFSDVGELFSDRGKGSKSRKFREKSDKEVLEQITVNSSLGLGEKHLLDLEGSASDPLQILADVSLDIGLQASAGESELAFHSENHKGKTDSSHHPGECGVLSTNPKTGNLKISVQGDRCRSSSSVQKSNLPGTITTTSGSLSSRISPEGAKEYSSTIAYKRNEPESLSANPENGSSKIIVQGGQEYSSIVKCGAVPEGISHDESGIKQVLSEADQTRCPYTIMRQCNFAENRQNPEVEILNDSCLDECEKNEDIDCMPLNPCEKVPQNPINQNGACGTFCRMFSGTKPDEYFKESEMTHPTKLAEFPKELHEHTDFSQSLKDDETSLNPSSKIPCITFMKQGDIVDASVRARAGLQEEVASTQQTTCTYPCMLTEIHSRESDIRVIADLTRALDKKGEVLKELRHMNDVISRKRMGGELALDSKQVIEQYNRMVQLLNEVNDEVASASHALRQHNMNKNSIPPWFRTSGNSTEYCSASDALIAKYLTEDSGSSIMEIIMSSRQKAKTMVDAAVLAMTSLQEGEDANMRIREALASAENQYGVDSNKQEARYPCSYPSAYQNKEASFTATVNAPDSRACFSSANESQNVSGLISDCIATFFMIQATSERRYPPADVARILEHAVESLQPRYSQNIPVYRDIEKCMGYIKTQMLSLVATPNANLPKKISV